MGIFFVETESSPLHQPPLPGTPNPSVSGLSQNPMLDSLLDSFGLAAGAVSA